MSNDTFIDLFAGCGGLSLGLMRAGWSGVFAIEKSPDAFLTLQHNLINKNIDGKFQWPEWLPCKGMTTSELLEKHPEELKSLKGKIKLIAGGPPCQGFSFAGRRNPKDPRNLLTEEYIKIVKIIQPQFLLLENVKGFNSAFKQEKGRKEKIYAEVVKKKLEAIGYIVKHRMCNASDFGVPQPRARFIMIAYHKNTKINSDPFALLSNLLPSYKRNKGLCPQNHITVKEAISDLEIAGKELIESIDSKGFLEIKYEKQELSSYQKLMRSKCNDNSAPNSLRLPRHRKETLNRFERILTSYEKGKSLTKEQLLELGTKKQCFTPLHPDMLSRTITTLPDDLLHYSEPRILTVRENARIQSFPDWFEFLGKYTTGGDRRKKECPRYTQVGNAVPPLMAEAIGNTLMQLNEVESE
ncbi:MAG: DNA cytosine methyltransferase [Alphaproteobacteria bacterium]